MRMSDFVVREAIVPNLTATTKEGVIREIVDSLRLAGYFQSGEADDIVRAILKREQLGSTGIGQGIALPHGKYAGVSQPIAALAVCRQPVNFDSIDGEPVEIVVLILGPYDPPGTRMRGPSPALERFYRQLRDADFRERLRQSTSAEEIAGVLNRDDSN